MFISRAVIGIAVSTHVEMNRIIDDPTGGSDSCLHTRGDEPIVLR